MGEVEAVLRDIRDEAVRTVDLRFSDLAGRWRHVGLEAADVTAALLSDGLLIDGSAIPGWREVTESDLLLKPDLAARHLDPFAAQPTLALVCDAAEPGGGLGYERCPRSAAARAEAWLARSRIADGVRVGVELDFLVADRVAVEAERDGAGYRLPPVERRRGHAFLAMPPTDATADIRAEIASTLKGLGLAGLRHAHGVGPGQCSLTFGAGGLVATADRVQLARHAAGQVAASYGKVASFLARPLAGQPGSGLRVHLALWQGERPVFAGTGYADLSPTCLHFIAGLIAHTKALNAFTNPATNSYRRLRPGQGEPVLLGYAAHNRSAAIRIPYAAMPAGKRVELRFPDPLANPYLAFAAALMAGLDGIERKLEPGDAVDRNLYDLAPAEREDLAAVAGSLDEALDALEADHDFLTRGEVVPLDLIEAYVRLKRDEAEQVARAPHPLEALLYGE
jgi:glutamine synthetase